MPGITGPSGRPTAISTQPKRGRGPHHHVEAAVDWCRQSCLRSFESQRTQPSFRFLSLGLAESRIRPAALVDTRPRTLVISFCTVQLRTLCAAHSLATLCLFTTSGSDPGELPGFWGSMVFRHVPIHRKGLGNQQQQYHLICFPVLSFLV